MDDQLKLMFKKMCSDLGMARTFEQGYTHTQTLQRINSIGKDIG